MKKRLKGLLWVLAAALVFRSCVMEPVQMTDDSMAPVLSEGDVALVYKLRYGIRVPGSGSMLVEWSKPKRGDLVVVVDVGDPPVTLMRKISAVPGDTVTMPDNNAAVLKQNEYFVRAEQENEVIDSRRIGPIPRRSVLGKVTHTWFAKKPSSPDGSKVESEKSRILQPIP